MLARTARELLAIGDVEGAEKAVGEALRRFPEDAGVRLWSARLAAMRWRQEDALFDLRSALRGDALDAKTRAEVNGEVGDLLLLLGRYGNAVPHLRAGQVGPLGAARAAWADIAERLPYVRAKPELAATELPMVEGPLPALICSIGERERPFVLDTGATFTTLSNSMAVELGVNPVETAGSAVDGTGQSFPISVGILPRLAVGEAEIGPHPVLVVEDARLALRDPFGGPARRLGALLGLDVLMRFRCTLDPARRSVVLQEPHADAERGSTPCLFVEGRLLVPVEVEDRRLWFALDTGASHSSLTAAGLEQLPGGEERAREVFRSVRSPGGGRIAVREVRGLSLRVSAVRFRDVDLPVVHRQPPELFPLHGVLGADLLQRCRATLDAGWLQLETL